MQHSRITLYTATSIVIANMIGTGVFTSLGFQAMGLHSGFSILFLWFVGGIAALCGALCYGEIGAMFPRSGGEYHYLTKIYHPSIGFVSGWVSATVGFAAPVAAAAIALGEYLNNVFPALDAKYAAAATVIGISVVHATSVKLGSIFQDISTTVKVAMIIAIIFCGFMAGGKGDFSFTPSEQAWTEITSSSFAISFFFVTLAYSGWNAAGYIASELKDAQRNLPKALLRGTALVMALYIGLNFIFMYTTPIAQMSTANGPVVDIAGVAASNIFGTTGGVIMSGIIAVLLLSTISAMVIAGPRVLQMMGEDYSIFKIMGKKNSKEIPAMAIVLQSLVSLIFIFTASFSNVITYISFSLSLFTFLTVLGLFIMRIREPNLSRPYKTFGYPIVPLLFLFICGYLLYYGFTNKTAESLWGLGTALAGLIFYVIDKYLLKKRAAQL
jgi:APA family basic amino acid/polyamine antiporter